MQKNTAQIRVHKRRPIYIPIPRHICKSVLMRRIIASHLCTAVGGRHISQRMEKTLKEIYV